MTLFYLIRHAHPALPDGMLAGRTPGIGLDDHGRAQSLWLAERLSRERIDAVYCSPLQRAEETAAPVAARRGLVQQSDAALNEIDFGAWTGKRFAELEADEHWRRFNARRSTTRTPAGELMGEAGARFVGLAERLAVAHPDGGVALVSHGDVIRAALLHWLGIPVDLYLRLEISQASVSMVRLAPWGPVVLCMNERCP